MPSLPGTITFSVATANDLVTEKVNQDNFGSTFRGSLQTATHNVVAIVKVKHSEEGPKTDPRERHSIDATLNYYPLDGSKGWEDKVYTHMIRRLGANPTDTDAVTSGIRGAVQPADPLGIAVANWGI